LYDEAPRLKCLSCDRLLAQGEFVCLSCGGVPFSRSMESDYAVVVEPVTSMAFRKQAGEVLADHIPGVQSEALNQALAKRTVVASHVDPVVGRALVERLKKIPAVAQLKKIDETGPSLLKRLVGPIPLLLYGVGLLAAIIVNPLALLVGIGAGLTVGTVQKSLPPSPATEPPVLPPPPPQAQALVKLLPKFSGAEREQVMDIARGGLGLVAAAHRQGLPSAAAEVEGMGGAVADVMAEAVEKGQKAADGDAGAKQRMQEIAKAVRDAAEKLGPKALPPAPEARLLEEAAVVKEIADL